VTASLPERIAWTAYLAYHWRGQSSFPFLSRQSIERAQSRRVKAMTNHAYCTVPYYRETMQRLGLVPADFRTASDLSRLPVIEREQLQRDPDYFESTATRRGRDLAVRSGGSTGAPRMVKWNTAAIFQNAGHAERERSIIADKVGQFVGYRESVIGSRFGSEQDVQAVYREHAILPRRTSIDYQHLSMEGSPEHNVEQLNQFRPDVLRSYGSYLGRLFSWVKETGAPLHRPKVVSYDADELTPDARRLITDEFGIEVLSAYQAVEAFKIGFECDQHTGIHLNTDLYPVRIVDDHAQEVEEGVSGQVIVSNLVNHATVLLNYRLGDVAKTIPGLCPCGRTLPLMSYIEGRVDDWIMLGSGESIHPQLVRAIFTEETSVRQYQVVQYEVNQFRVAIESLRAESGLAERIRSRFTERFGNVGVDVRFVDRIAPSPGGKFRTVISMANGRN